MNEQHHEGHEINEPVLRVPPVLTALLFTMLAIHLALYHFLPPTTSIMLLELFAFIPAQFAAGHHLWSLLTSALFHVSWEHFLFNSLWLVAFGTPVARRLASPARFLLFFAVCCIGAMLTHWLFYIGDTTPVIGASGGVSAMLGAAARFAFNERNWFLQHRKMETSRLLPLKEVLRRRQVIIFITLWTGLNVVFGLMGTSLAGESISIAWEAHIGGFFCGLLLFSLFDIPPMSASGGPGNRDYGTWSGARSANDNNPENS